MSGETPVYAYRTVPGRGASGRIGTFDFVPGRGASGRIGTLDFVPGRGASGNIGTFEAYEIAMLVAMIRRIVIPRLLTRFAVFDMVLSPSGVDKPLIIINN